METDTIKVKFLNRNTILMNIKSNLDIVNWMTKNDYDITVVEPVNKFMKAYSERKHLFDKINIRYDNADNFVSDLVAHKIIEFR